MREISKKEKSHIKKTDTGIPVLLFIKVFLFEYASFEGLFQEEI